LISCPIFAQEENSEEGSSGGMAGTGDLLFEVTGTPFLGSSLLNFSEFRARYFLAENMAIRLGLAMDLYNDQSSPDLVINDSYYGIMPGFEYHLDNDGSFRSYAAVDFTFGQRIASRKSTTSDNVTGATDYNVISEFATGRGYMQLGGRLSIGAEYHFNSRFYIGGEVGFQYSYFMNDEIFVNGESVQASTTRSTGALITANSLRIGFRFLTL
jgi:hypothetical protein